MKASTGQIAAFVSPEELGERRLQESARGLGRLGIMASARQQTQQTHLAIPERDFDSRFDEVVGRAARFMIDTNVQRAVGFDTDGFDEHPGHVRAHQALEAAVKEVRNTGRELGHRVISRFHSGIHQVKAMPRSMNLRVGAMAEHRSQYNVSADGPGSYASEVIVGGHAVESATWEMLRAGGILPLIHDGETYHER